MVIPGYRTLEVLETRVDETGRVPVAVHVEKQQRVRPDESVTRPFIKIQLAVGARTIYCDLRQARALSEFIDLVLPSAEQALEELLSSPDRHPNNRYQSPGVSHTEDGTPVAKRRVRRRVRQHGEEASQ